MDSATGILKLGFRNLDSETGILKLEGSYWMLGSAVAARTVAKSCQSRNPSFRSLVAESEQIVAESCAVAEFDFIPSLSAPSRLHFGRTAQQLVSRVTH